MSLLSPSSVPLAATLFPDTGVAPLAPRWEKQSLIGQQGLRPGDQLVLAPLHGQRRIFPLHRADYKIISGPCFKYDSAQAVLTLPSGAQENFSYQLRLYYPAGRRPCDQDGRYVLMAEQMAFRINQSTSFCSLLERGDELMLGFNKLCCTFPEKMAAQAFPDHPILEQYTFLQSALPLVISGEPGTGKRRLAHQAHQASGRRGGLVEINCLADLPAEIDTRDATLMVRMPLATIWPKLQKLLLPRGHHPPLARLILLYTTPAVGRRPFPSGDQHHWPPEALDFLGQGQSITLSPLREQPHLIRAYCLHFAQQHNVLFTARLLAWYEHYDWPGNFRELENHLQLKWKSSRWPKIDLDALDAGLIPRSPSRTLPLLGRPWPLKYFQQQYVAQIFFAVGNHCRKAAELLGVTENTVRRMLKL